jgi:putative (di)nucleoside polyphosphate hydrolase
MALLARSRRLSATNVNIILCNGRNEVSGASASGTSWQLQGRISLGNAGAGDVPRTAGEVGLTAQPREDTGADAQLAALQVPARWLKREWRGTYRGQKQIWFLLRLVGRECDVRLRASERPEFDAWRWNDYWIPLDSVIDFKREVYQHALTELARYLFRGQGRKPVPAEIASR